KAGILRPTRKLVGRNDGHDDHGPRPPRQGLRRNTNPHSRTHDASATSAPWQLIAALAVPSHFFFMQRWLSCQPLWSAAASRHVCNFSQSPKCTKSANYKNKRNRYATEIEATRDAANWVDGRTSAMYESAIARHARHAARTRKH